MAKLKIGTPVLVVGPFLNDKAEVVSIEKGVYTLNNNLKIDRNFNVLVKSDFICKPFDQVEYDFLQAKIMLQTEINKLYAYKDLPKEDMVELYNKVKKLNRKYFDK